MENATKALLIAAAILVAILIISLGLVVYNMAAETVQGVTLSDTEIQAHNDKFLRYEGEAQRGSQVNAMLQTVLSSNMNETDEGKKVTVYNGSGTASVLLGTSSTTSPNRVDTGKSFHVWVVYDTDSRLITEIHVDEN